MERLQIGPVRLEVERIPSPTGGALAPVVFLHEGLGSVAMWRDWPQRVCEATGREGVVYSRRGYGASDTIADVRGAGRLGPDYMHREALEVLPQLFEALGISEPVLLGHSDGGTISLIHAAHERVTACIVMAPHVIVEDVSVRSIEQARRAFESAGLRERLGKFHENVDVAFWQWNDIWLDARFRDFDIRSDCRRIHAPVLAIQGADDPYGTLRQIEEIAPTAGPFRKEVLASCGHSPHRDQADATLALVKAFLAPLP